jgi:hypothetical protein
VGKSTKGHEMTEAQMGRWYMVNRDGMATLCADREDAEKEAADAQSVWPHMGPHRAVQLPAVAGKPVAWLSPWRADQVTTDYDAYGEHGIPLYTAPKPVEREPLTDEWIRSRCKEPWVFETAKQWVRMAEAAHGIKGGQHGTE